MTTPVPLDELLALLEKYPAITEIAAEARKNALREAVVVFQAIAEAVTRALTDEIEGTT